MSKGASFLGTVSALFTWRWAVWVVGEGGFPHSCSPDPGFYQGDESLQSCTLGMGQGAHALGMEYVEGRN